MAFIKVESEDMKIEETFRVKQDTEEQTKMVFIKEESENMRIEETFRVKHEDTEEQTKTMFIKKSENVRTEETSRVEHEDPEDQIGAKTGTEKTYKGRRQTKKLASQKDCHTCKEKIGVARKTCPHCGAKQPYKQKLEERKKYLAQGWKDQQKNPSTVSKVYEATELLLHKWDLLERYPVLLLARKTNKGFSAECFCPWQMNSEETQDACVTIKKQYESLLNVVIADKLASSNGKTPATNITKTKITPLANVSPSEPASESKPPLTPESEPLTPVSSSSASPVPSSFHSTQTSVVSCTTSFTPPVSLSVAPPLSSLTHPDFISSQSSPVSSSLSSALPSAPTLSTCSKLTPVSTEQGTPDSESSLRRKKPTRRKEGTSGAKPGMKQTYKARQQTTKLPFQKDCNTCKERIGVASKTCPHCGAKQPYKQKLEERKKYLAQGWKDRQKKNSSVNKVYDATELLLHKWNLLERYPVLLLARRSIKGFSTECFCPWQMNSVKTQDAFVTIKRLYERLLNVVIADELSSSIGKTPAKNITQTEITPLKNVCPLDPETESDTLTPVSSSTASPVPSSFHSTQTSVVSCTTSLTPPVSLSVVAPLSSLSHPDFISSQSSPVSSSLSSALPSVPTLSTCSKLTPVSIEQGTPDSESSSRRKKTTKRKENTCECPVHEDSTSFPYKKILRKRIREGHAEVLVQWYPCSGCGAEWENSWEPKENIED